MAKLNSAGITYVYGTRCEACQQVCSQTVDTQAAVCAWSQSHFDSEFWLSWCVIHFSYVSFFFLKIKYVYYHRHVIFFFFFRGPHFEGSRPEWCISSMIYSLGTPFWSDTLDLHIVFDSYYHFVCCWSVGDEEDRDVWMCYCILSVYSQWQS